MLIPDLYRGKLTLDAKEAEHTMTGLDWPGAVQDVRVSTPPSARTANPPRPPTLRAFYRLPVLLST